jgi:hypothetical protein
MRIVAITVVPLLAVATALIFRRFYLVRIVAVTINFLSALSVLGVLTAPHRLAHDRYNVTQNQDWWRGAADTRDAVHGVVPVLPSCFVALGPIALVPFRKDVAGRS